MSDDIVDRFNTLDIEDFEALGFDVRAPEKLVLRLDDIMRVYRTTEDAVSSFYELQFNRILGGHIKAEGPWLGKIKRWRASRESELLAEKLEPSKNTTHAKAFAHFELTCDEGELSVVARDFFLTVVGKGTLRRDGGGGSAHPVKLRKKSKAP